MRRIRDTTAYTHQDEEELSNSKVVRRQTSSHSVNRFDSVLAVHRHHLAEASVA